MVKTHLSLSDNPALKGVPQRLEAVRPRRPDLWRRRDLWFLSPAPFSLMPGTGSNPAFRRVDVDVETGKVKGVF